MSKVAASELSLIQFPDCYNKCKAGQHFGVGECDSICPYKFDDKGESKSFTEEDAKKYWDSWEKL